VYCKSGYFDFGKFVADLFRFDREITINSSDSRVGTDMYRGVDGYFEEKKKRKEEKDV
jgi:hypothetical protein